MDIETQLREAARKSGLSMKRMSDETGIPYAAVHNFVARWSGADDANGVQAGDVARAGAAPGGAAGREVRTMAKKRQRAAPSRFPVQTERAGPMDRPMVRT